MGDELSRTSSAEAQSLGVQFIQGARPPAMPWSDQSNKYHTQAQNREGARVSSSWETGKKGEGRKEEERETEGREGGEKSKEGGKGRNRLNFSFMDYI